MTPQPPSDLTDLDLTILERIVTTINSNIWLQGTSFLLSLALVLWRLEKMGVTFERNIAPPSGDMPGRSVIIVDGSMFQTARSREREMHDIDAYIRRELERAGFDLSDIQLTGET